MADLEVTGAEETISLHEELQAADVDLWLARLHGQARVTAEKAGVIDAIGEERLLPTVRAARAVLQERAWTCRETRHPTGDEPLLHREG